MSLQRCKPVTLSTSNLFALAKTQQECLKHQQPSIAIIVSSVADELAEIASDVEDELREFTAELREEIDAVNIIFSYYIHQDFFHNITILSLPALFSNFFYELTTIYEEEILQDTILSSVGESLLIISMKLAVVFGAYFVIDGLRQLFLYYRSEIIQDLEFILEEVLHLTDDEKEEQFQEDDKKKDWNGNVSKSELKSETQENIPSKIRLKIKHTISAYLETGIISSLKLAIIFAFARLFWMIAKNYSENTGSSYEAFICGIGAGFGLLLGSQLIVISQYFVSRNKEQISDENGFLSFWSESNDHGLLGVTIKAFVEGFVFEIVSDLYLEKIFEEDWNMNDVCSALLACLIESIAVCISIPFIGLFTSSVGFCWYHYQYSQMNTSLDDLEDVSILLFGQNDTFSNEKHMLEEHTPLLENQ